MKHALLELEQHELEQLKGKLLKTGAFPLKNMASAMMDAVEEEVEKVRVLFKASIEGDEERTIAIDIVFEELNVQLKGSINRVYGNKLIIISWSKNSTKYLLDSYIKYLCVRAAGLELDCYFISAAKEATYKAQQLAPAEAKERLSELMQLYQNGHHHPSGFYLGFNFQPKDIDNLTQENFIKGVHGRMTQYNYAIDDLYIIQKYKEGFFNETSTFEQFQDSAKKLLLPLEEIFPDYYN